MWSSKDTIGREDIITDERVGVTVDTDASLSVYGPAQEIFNLTRSIPANRFTSFQSVISVTNSIVSVGFCFFTNLPDEFRIDRSRCHEVESSQDVDVPIGILLNGKQTDINFIGVIQEANLDASSVISSIRLVQGENTDIYDENGCKDPNALTSGNDDATVCTCKDGYVASNGGKRQGEFDSCVKCISSEYCRFDGDQCTSNEDCTTSECVESFSDEPKCNSSIVSFANHIFRNYCI